MPSTADSHTERSPLLAVTAPAQRNGHATANRCARADSPYLLDISTARFWLIFAPILIGYFVAMFDSYFMASSHPVITSYFHASNSASWLSTAFMLTSTAVQPIFGRLSDTVGRRPVYLTSQAAFSLATLWCAMANSIASLIAARAVCGIAAGGMMAMANIMTNDIVKIEVRGTYQAYINLLFGSGAAFGSAFGGALCDSIGWRGAFAVQIIPISITMAISYFSVPHDLGPQLAQHSKKRWFEILREFDLAGSFFLALSVASLILGMNLGGNVYPWTHPLVCTSLVVAVLAAAILIRVESRHARPVMPLPFLVSRPRANLVFANFFAMIGINHVIFNAPVYFQAVHGDTPTVAGYRLGIPAVLTTCSGVATGFWLTWTGRMKAPQVIGGLAMLLSAVCLSVFQHDSPIWLASAFVAPSGIGQGLMFPATTISVLATSAKADQAVMTSTLMLWRNLGTVMGVAISSLVLQNTLSAYLDSYVTGPHKAKIIQQVRKSVRAVLDLKGEHRIQAVHAYSAALRMTFVSAIVFFLLVNLLVLPARLPRLGQTATAAAERTAERAAERSEADGGAQQGALVGGEQQQQQQQREELVV